MRAKHAIADEQNMNALRRKSWEYSKKSFESPPLLHATDIGEDRRAGGNAMLNKKIFLRREIGRSPRKIANENGSRNEVMYVANRLNVSRAGRKHKVGSGESLALRPFPEHFRERLPRNGRKLGINLTRIVYQQLRAAPQSHPASRGERIKIAGEYGVRRTRLHRPPQFSMIFEKSHRPALRIGFGSQKFYFPSSIFEEAFKILGAAVGSGVRQSEHQKRALLQSTGA